MRRILYGLIILGLLIAAACNRESRQAEADMDAAQTEVAVAQATVDSMNAASRQTAEAWMAAEPMESTQPMETPPAAMTASIQGELDYPAAEIPPLRVVAINVETNEFYSVEVKGPTYTIEALPPGSYQVVAYVMKTPGFQEGQAGGYTQAVLCGLSLGCTDHALVIVELEEGDQVEGVNPGDWGAPEGSFPLDPTRSSWIER